MNANTEVTKPTEQASPQAQPAEDLQKKMLDSIAQAEAKALAAQQEAKRYQQQLEQLTKQIESWKADPAQALKALQVDLDKLYDILVAKPSQPDASKLERELETIKAKLEEQERLAARQARLRNIADMVQQLIESKEEYKPIKTVLDIEGELYGQRPDLAQIITAYMREDTEIEPEQLVRMMAQRAIDVMNRIKRSSALAALLAGAEKKQQEQPQQTAKQPVATPDAAGQHIGPEGKSPAMMSRGEWLQYALNKLRRGV